VEIALRRGEVTDKPNFDMGSREFIAQPPLLFSPSVLKLAPKFSAVSHIGGASACNLVHKADKRGVHVLKSWGTYRNRESLFRICMGACRLSLVAIRVQIWPPQRKLPEMKDINIYICKCFEQHIPTTMVG
jgi:hypothetical protein